MLMKGHNFIVSVLFIALSVLGIWSFMILFAQDDAEVIHFSSYYPSPDGVYFELSSRIYTDSSNPDFYLNPSGHSGFIPTGHPLEAVDTAGDLFRSRVNTLNITGNMSFWNDTAAETESWSAWPKVSYVNVDPSTSVSQALPVTKQCNPGDLILSCFVNPDQSSSDSAIYVTRPDNRTCTAIGWTEGAMNITLQAVCLSVMEEE